MRSTKSTEASRERLAVELEQLNSPACERILQLLDEQAVTGPSGLLRSLKKSLQALPSALRAWRGDNNAVLNLASQTG